MAPLAFFVVTAGGASLPDAIGSERKPARSPRLVRSAPVDERQPSGVPIQIEDVAALLVGSGRNAAVVVPQIGIRETSRESSGFAPRGGQ